MPGRYVKGQWNVLCDRCGFKYKSAQLRTEWNGLKTCSGPSTNDCWEKRHPQDFVKGRKDKQTPEWVRPEPEDEFVVVGPPDWDAL
jgi:hypothetical protein